MGLSDIDGKTIVMACAASLTAYVFYGHINLAADVKAMQTKQEQVVGEQKDIWAKYNDDMDDKVDFMTNYFSYQLEMEERWTEYWKVRAKEAEKQ